MSVVEEVRGAMQDFLTPELRALKERLAALEKKVDERIDALERKVDEHEGLAEQRSKDAKLRAETRHAELVNRLNLAARVSKLEQKESTQ